MEVVIKQTNIKTDGDCYTEFKNAFHTLAQKLISTEGRKEASTQLQLTSQLTDNLYDIQNVQFKIFDALQGIIQYTYDNRVIKNQRGKDWTIQRACELMTDASKKPLEKLGSIYILAHVGDTGNEKLDPVYANYIKPLADTTYKGTDEDAYRGWMWLSCNQLGLLQSTSGSEVFGEAVTIGFLYKMCADMFDQKLNAEIIDQHVERTLNRYGYPWEYNATNVVLPAGGFDPWSVLRVNVSNPKIHQIEHLTPGAAHCSDMYPPYNGEPDGLKETRQLVATEVKYYLSQAAPQPVKKDNFASNSQISNVLLAISLFIWQFMLNN